MIWHRLIVGYTPRKLFGTWTIPQLQQLREVNRFLTSQDVPLGTACRFRFVDDTLMVVRKENSLGI